MQWLDHVAPTQGAALNAAVSVTSQNQTLNQLTPTAARGKADSAEWNRSPTGTGCELSGHVSSGDRFEAGAGSSEGLVEVGGGVGGRDE